MAIVRETHNLRCNTWAFHLAPVASDFELIWWGTDDLSFYTTFRNRRRAVLKPAMILEVALMSDDEGLPSNPTRSINFALDVSQHITKLLNHQRLHPSLCSIVQDKESRIKAFELDEPLFKAAENARWHTFQDAYEESNSGLKKALYLIREVGLKQNDLPSDISRDVWT